MSKTRTKRQSLTMPIQEIQSLSISKELNPSGRRETSERSQSGSREREPPTSRSDSFAQDAARTPSRPRTPTSPISAGLPLSHYNINNHKTSPAASPPRQDPRDASKAFFGNTKGSRTGTKLVETTVRRVPQEGSSSSEDRKPVRTKSTPDLRAENNIESVPDIPPIDQGSQYSHISQQSRDLPRIPRRPVNQPPAITVPRSTANHTFGPGSPAYDPHDRKNNGNSSRRFFGMKRNTSSRGEEIGSYSKPSTPTVAKAPEITHGKPPSRDQSTGRNPSPLVETDDMLSPPQAGVKDQRSQSFRDGPGSVLFKGLTKSAAKATAGLSKTRNWLGGGSGGTHHGQKTYSSTPTRREPLPNYQPVNLVLPIQKQTRITRIAKRLEDSKDKTEFWMPALPWRCIDYLNFNGCETEGLYRVPGSDRDVKWYWQKFDQEHDINLFEEDELYDVNIIGSLFKMWLRNLPEPILDEAIQDDLIARYEDHKQAPEELKVILSKLPPWNYYLLFAITCHLSLLNAYEDKNKMTLQNLFICVGPALKMKQRCFTWLVGDWRSCWTGCTTEKGALEEEYQILDSELAPAGDGHRDEHGSSVSSSASGEPTLSVAQFEGNGRSLDKSATDKPIRRGKHSLQTSPGLSKDDSHLPSTPGPRDESQGSPTHGRSHSHIPELNFPGKMSPLFPPDERE